MAKRTILAGNRSVVTGGTGSLGKRLVYRLLNGELGQPSQVVVFSRDETKQHAMRLESHNYNWNSVTDEVVYSDTSRLQFVIGDVRDIHAITSVLQGADIVIHAAAMKQVPACEYNPLEAIQTNILGSSNILQAIHENRIPVESVVGISTDKAVKPINLYGMTKAIQEVLFTVANLRPSTTKFASVRYGNVLSSRGSVVPLFQEQVKRGGPVTITSLKMTRFFFTLDQAIDAVFACLLNARKGEIYVPNIRSVLITDLVSLLVGDSKIDVKVVGIRPGEKMHEELISREEMKRTESRDNYYVIHPNLPEIQSEISCRDYPHTEYSSSNRLMSKSELLCLLKKSSLLSGNIT